MSRDMLSTQNCDFMLTAKSRKLPLPKNAVFMESDCRCLDKEMRERFIACRGMKEYTLFGDFRIFFCLIEQVYPS